MAVVPLVPGKSVARTEEEFEHRGARHGSTLLIRNFDSTQLSPGDPNLSYDLRIGSVYKDHRDGLRKELQDDGHITLLPGGAIVIETEESWHMPAGLFGYIVPRVKWLQQGVSNTLSKVDSGYNGKLLVTLFNLGKNTVPIDRKDGFCSLVVHDVGEGACLYEGNPKTIAGAGACEPIWIRIRSRVKAKWQAVRDRLDANRPFVELMLILVTGALALVEALRLFGVDLTGIFGAGH
jgi:deoxycytidine triphosphate deaminase